MKRAVSAQSGGGTTYKKKGCVPMLAALKKHWKIYAFLVPVFIPLIVFGYLPALDAFKLSFTDASGAFVGLEHFEDLVSDRRLIASISNMVKLLIVSLITGNIPALLVAELLYNMKSRRSSDAYRFLFIVPMLIPTLVIYLVWQFLIFDSDGLANALLAVFGLEPSAWLNGTSTALSSMMLIGFPWVSGTAFLIYLAGLQGIPESVLESCKLDGASFWVRFRKIDLPLLLGQLKLQLIMGIIGGIQAFQLQMMTTNGGPRNATMVPGLWMYKRAFEYGEMNYASAIGLAMFLIILILTIINNKYINTDVDK